MAAKDTNTFASLIGSKPTAKPSTASSKTTAGDDSFASLLSGKKLNATKSNSTANSAGDIVAVAKLKGSIAKSNAYTQVNNSLPEAAQSGLAKVLGAATDAVKFATGNNSKSLADKIASASDLQKILDQKQVAVDAAMKDYLNRFNETAKPGETPSKETLRRMRLLAEADANGRGQEPALLKAIDNKVGRATGSVLDLLSRGQYASANAADAYVKGVKKNPFNALGLLAGGPGTALASVDNKTKVNMLKGAGNGLTGHTKGSYYKVLEDAGVHNKIALAIGGTLGDVFLDPSTYVTGGLAKAATEADKAALIAKNMASAVATHEAELATTKYIKEYAKGGKAWKAADEAAKQQVLAEARKKAAQEAKALKATGLNLKKEQIQSILDAHLATAEDAHAAASATAKYGKELAPGSKAWKAREAAAREVAIKAGEEAGLKAVAALRPGAVTLKFAGVPVLSSELAYSAGKKVADKVASSGFGQLIERGFRTDYTSIGKTMVKDQGLNADRRMILNGGIHQLKKNVEDMQSVFAVLTPAEKRLITEYRDKGIPHAVAHLPLANDPSRKLGEFFNHVDTYFRDSFQQQSKAGVLRRNVEDYVPNYVPFYSEAGIPEQATIFKRERTKFKKEAKKAAGRGEILSKPELSLTNPDVVKKFAPTMQIDNIIAKHMQESYHKAAWTEFFSDALDKFGAKISDPSARDLALKHGMVPVKDGGDYMVHKSVGDVLDQINLTRKNVKSSNHVADQLAQIQSLWKFGKTGVNPGHHVMNMLGDSTTAMIDGTNPLHIMEGIGVMSGSEAALKKTTSVELKDGARMSLSNSDILDMYRKSGADAGYHIIQTSEDALTDTFAGKLLSSPPAEKIRAFSEGREASVRFGHFKSALLDELKQGKKIEQAIHDAAGRVLKFEKDYSALTAFEKGLRKGPIPFYTWMRKNTPLMFEMMLTRPGKTIAPLKAINNTVTAITGNKPENPFELIKAPWQALMPAILGEDSTMSNLLLDNGLPVQDGINMAQHMVNGDVKGITNDLMSSLSPGISFPVNTLTDASTKPYKQKVAQEAAGLLPFGPSIYKALDHSVDKNTGQANVSDKERLLEIVRLMTGLRMYQSQASDKLKIVNRSNSAQLKEIKRKLGVKK